MTEQRQYGVGLIGAGWVAGEYVKALRDHPQTQIAGIYNRTPGKATSLLQSHGVEANEYATLDDFFADDRIDIVVSCTHPHVRAGHCVRAGGDRSPHRDREAGGHHPAGDGAHPRRSGEMPGSRQ